MSTPNLAPMFVRAGAAVFACASLFALTSCGDDDTGASASTVEIQPSSYVVKEPATTTTPTTVVPGPDVEGLSAGEQAFTIQSSNDVPWVVASCTTSTSRSCATTTVGTRTSATIPGIGGTVRIPPGAKFIDPSVTTTTAAGEDDDDEDTDSTDATGDTTEAPGGDRCNPIYVIEAGDAPLVITRKFDITLEALNAANTATPDWPNLYTGREIKLPPPADCT